MATLTTTIETRTRRIEAEIERYESMVTLIDGRGTPDLVIVDDDYDRWVCEKDDFQSAFDTLCEWIADNYDGSDDNEETITEMYTDVICRDTTEYVCRINSYVDVEWFTELPQDLQSVLIDECGNWITDLISVG